MPEPQLKPHDEYCERLAARSRLLDGLRRHDLWYANGRLIAFVLCIVVLWLAFSRDALHVAWAGVPFGAFVALVILHERTLRAQANAEGAVRFYESGLSRLEDRWAGLGTPGDDLAVADHLYAEDLDLFGVASLFELMCTARTRDGEEALAAWMSAPAPPQEIVARQEAVEELRGQVDLREDLAIVGAHVRQGVRPGMLKDWASSAPVLRAGAWWRLATLLSGVAVLAFAGWAAGWWTLGPLAVVALVDLAYLRWVKEDVLRVTSALGEPVKDLNVLARVAARIETGDFASERLHRIQAGLTADRIPASVRIRQLSRLFTWLEASKNQMFAPIAFVLLWNVHFAYLLERWRVRYGAFAPRWLEAVGDFEALCALAGYAYEHPDDPFPEIVEGGAVYEGKDLGHPLLPDRSCVRNSVDLGDAPRLLVVSGSNMSGKSTLLRVVGINAVLAFMGAPVRAKSLRVSPMVLGASLHVVDSIQSGTSHFYAEITRLREIMEAARRRPPALFLIDEILHGTNSHDRAIGAEAVLKGLVDQGAIGLVTTHDLALTRVQEAFGSRAANVHFVDRLKEGELVFDYRMRPGVVERSNALALMRRIGLDV